MIHRRSEYDKLPMLDQAEHQEELMDVFNSAFFKIDDQSSRKDVVDLINIYVGIRFQSRLWKIPTTNKQYYGMFPIDLTDKDQTTYLQKKLSAIFQSAEEITAPDEVDSEVNLTSDEIDIALEDLATRFIDEDVSYEVLVDGLKYYILKEAEIELLKVSGRINEGEKPL